jgi:hypothetical protein
MAPLETSLKEMKTWQRPLALDTDPASFDEIRVNPYETQVWDVRAKVLQAVIRPDGDLYLVISEDGVEGVAEIPDPRRSHGSRFADQILELRGRLGKEIHPTEAPKRIDREAELTGVGFFGTASRGDNGARLLPLLDLKWLDSKPGN